MQFDLQFQKKHKVDLSEYTVDQDLFFRAKLAELEPTTTRLMIELFYLSSKTTLPKLKNALDLTENELKLFFDRMAPFQILSLEQDVVLIDKEVKKKIECFLAKFEEDFIAGIEYFQALLKQVPISILPTWYSLPRSCDSIFLSLKEKIFQTPAQYLRHIKEVETEKYPIQPIVNALLANPSAPLKLFELKKLTGLDGAELDECILFLEFNFIAVLTYRENEEKWDAELSLPEELKNYLKKQSVTPPFTDLVQFDVVPDRGIPLTFAFDLSQAIRFAKLYPLKVSLQDEAYTFDPFSLEKLKGVLPCSTPYLVNILLKGLDLDLLRVVDGFVTLHPQAEPWLLYSIEKQALSLYKVLWMQKNQSAKQAEKGLSTIISRGWVLADEVIDFISSGKPVLSRGRDGYIYEIQDEVKLTHEHLNTLFESGLIEWGTFEKKRCLRLTELGKQICA
jgi:hypothetical protein